jgi:hypothetical protein
LQLLLIINSLSTRPKGRPRNRWQYEVRGDGRIVGGEEWQEKVYNREERKKLFLLLTVGPAESRLAYCSLARLIVLPLLLIPPFISRSTPCQMV